MNFMGYRRKDGGAGTRNYVGVFSTVVCANEVAESIQQTVRGTASFQHHQGCAQTPVDIRRVNEVLINLGKNPNLASVLLVSLGCESTAVEQVAKEISATGKRVETVEIQDIGGAGKTIAEGALLAQDMVLEASKQEKTTCFPGDIVLGLKCGSSDTTQGLAANPALGLVSDLVVDAGGTSILGEVTEFIGAEHLLAKHARTEQIGNQMLELVKRMEDRVNAVGVDMRGGQPTGGNIKGGLTTIEEKSLGAIAKAGNAPIEAVYEYGQIPVEKGLVIMDSPGREPEILTGLAAAGCNVIAFTTGRGAPQGFPFVPVVKITGNHITWQKLRDHMDLNVSSIMSGKSSIAVQARRILEKIMAVASGELTKAEISGYTKAMDIYTIGPVI